MPLFNLKNAKKRLSSSSLSLRKTQSTGDIEEENVFTNEIKSSKSSPTTTTTTTTTVKKPTHISSMTTKRPTTGILLNSSSSTTTTTVPSSLLLTPVVEQPNESVSTTTTNDLLTAKLKDITACDMDLLLALETQARMDIQEEKQLLLQRRPTRLTFDIPPTPSITTTTTTTTTRIDDQGEKKNRSDSSSSLPTITSSGKEFNLSHTFFSKTKLSRWSRALHKEEGHTTTVLEDYADPVPVIQQSILIGSKVKLIKRPLPIIGTVKYIGKVHFDSSQEDWLGIELDTRVGNTDGKVGDTRYFQTKSNCGIFVRKQDTIKV